MFTNRHQIYDLAPDVETAKRANGFSRANQWIELEGNEKILWGTVKTQKAKYAACASLTKKKFKCSCKNKMPCRHVLGLLLVYLNASDRFRVTYDLPEAIQLWLNDGESIKIDPQKAAQNQENKLRNHQKRLKMMEAGLGDLEIWLADVIRQGLASLEQQNPDFWLGIAARMVDAKLGSIGRRIRLMPEYIQTHDNWYEHILMQLGEIYLIVKGFRNIERLPENLQQEMLNIAGVNYKKEDLLKQEGLQDNWLIMAQVSGVEEKLNFRRTWFIGEQTKRWAMLLEFTWGNERFQHQWKVGQLIEGSLVYYPSSYPLRALFKNYAYLPRDLETFPAYTHNTAFLTAYAKAIAANPWLQEFPASIKEVVPVMKANRMYLVDRDKKMLPLVKTSSAIWKLLAISSGHPIRVFGEWNGLYLTPISAFYEGRFCVL